MKPIPVGKVNEEKAYVVVSRKETTHGVSWRVLRLWTRKEWDAPKTGHGAHWIAGLHPPQDACDTERLTSLIVRSGRGSKATEWVVGPWSESRVLIAAK